MVIGIYGQKMPYLLSYTFATKQMSKAPVDPKELHNNLSELIRSYPHKVFYRKIVVSLDVLGIRKVKDERENVNRKEK